MPADYNGDGSSLVTDGEILAEVNVRTNTKDTLLPKRPSLRSRLSA